MSAETFNPFPGLRSFEEHEDHLFFGREHDLDELLRRLRTTHFLAVLGTSGSGKSSLVKSGLIPSLYAGFMSRAGSRWRIAVMHPGEAPIANLATALNRPTVLGGDDEDLAAMQASIVESTLRRGNLGLVQVVREARLDEADRLLVIVDQFEELFRFKRSRKIQGSHDEAVSFVQLLLGATAQTQVPIYVVITMRSDFLGNCTEIPRLVETINKGQYLVPLMDREQRRSVIVGPVAVGGGKISQRLVLRLLNDAGDDPDQLPMLQHALMRTWDRWASEPDDDGLDLRHYEAIGTLHTALDTHAEEAYAELDERQRRIAERLFKCLTEKEGDSQRGIRRPSPLAEVCEVAEADPAEVVAVVDVFRRPGRSFLMPAAGTELNEGSVLDISHESLMRVWKRLIGWVDEESAAAAFYQRLSLAAHRHEDGTAGLWRNPELQLAVTWRDENRPTAAWAQRYAPDFEHAIAFLETSQAAYEHELAEKERERLRKLRAARILAAAMGIAALLALALGAVFFQLKRSADAAREEADGARLAALEAQEEAEQAQKVAETERTEALRQKKIAEDALAEARRQRDRAEEQEGIAVEQKTIAEAQEREAQTQRRVAEEERGKAVGAQREAEEQRTIAIEQKELADTQRAKAVSAEQESERLRLLAEAEALAVHTVAMTEEPLRELAALLSLASYRLTVKHGGEAESPQIYNALRLTASRLLPDDVRVVQTHSAGVRSLAISADGTCLASGSEDGEVRSVDPRAPRQEARIVGRLGSSVRALAFAPQGRQLAAGAADGTLRLWALGPAEAAPRTLSDAGDAVNALAFHPASERLAAGDASGKVRLWEEGSKEARTLTDDASDVRDLAWSADGAWLAAATDSGVLLWHAERLEAPPRRLGAPADVRSVAWSADGSRLAAGTAHGPVVMWMTADLDATPVELRGHSARVEALRFHPARDLLASGSLDGTLRLWDVRDPDTLPIILEGHGSWVRAAVFSPDGNRLFSASRDRTVRLWTTRSAELAEQICRGVTRELTEQEWAQYLGTGVEYEKSCP